MLEYVLRDASYVEKIMSAETARYLYTKHSIVDSCS